MISVDANLFRIAAFAVSTEKTRYYLLGVYIEPHPVKGVIMTATSGHVLTTIHDESGDMGGCSPAIVKLPGKVLAECKAKKTTEPRMLVDPSADLATVQVDGKEKTRAYCVIVDGTFPDWRCLHPLQVKDRAGADAAFSHLVMRVLVDTAAALESPMAMSNVYANDVALVNFPGRSHVSCLAVPFRADTTPRRPYWL